MKTTGDPDVPDLSVEGIEQKGSSSTNILAAEQSGGAESPVQQPRRKVISRPHANLDKQILKKVGELEKSASYELSELGEVISLKKDGLDVRQRVDLLKSLGASPTSEEIDMIMGFIMSTEIPEGMRESSYHWLVDELITTLRHYEYPRAELTQNLAYLSGRQTKDLVIRDYALQHLGHLVEEGGDEALIRQSLNAALSEKQGTIAGTALLALRQWPVDEEVLEKSQAIADDESMSKASRVTARELVKLLSSQ